MKLKCFLAGAAAFCALGVTASANAGITTYAGQDDGVAIGGAYTNSNAAQTSLLAAAGTLGSGMTATETFEELATPIALATPFAITGGVVKGAGYDYGCPYTGVCTGPYTGPYAANLYGFDTTPGGNNWFGFGGGSATFYFAHPTNAFGFYATGVQTVFTSALTVSFNDGTSEVLNAPVNVNGGVEYFGFTDTTAVTSVTISDPGTANGTDAIGIDDVSYNTAVPEPATWAMMLLGLGGLGGAMRMRRKANIAIA